MDTSFDFESSTDAFAFHATPPENVDSIHESGITPDSAMASDSTDIVEVLESLGYSDPFTFKRTEVTYCHIDSDYVSDLLEERESESDSIMSCPDKFIVVKLDEIPNPMYLADMGIITDLIDYRYAGEEHLLYADSPEEVVEKYQESIIRVQSGSDIVECKSTFEGYPELVIDGVIPPSAIQTVL